jgi:Lon protease-like protein
MEPLEREDLAALPIFPLPDAALFPGTMLPLHVFEPRYRELARDTIAGRGVLAVARLQPGFERNYAGRPPVFEVCGVGRIVDHRIHEDGRYDLVLQGLARIRILEELAPAHSYRQVRAVTLEDLPADPALSAALKTSIATLWHSLAPHLPVATDARHRRCRWVCRSAGATDRG